ncbi:cell division protein FtsK [Nesterenkonia cremea]|uniref:FtsK domain-containing protein n=1 Tax=Nesterenkonia cremea TaxID=1882340 RepID=A0A917AXI1_9MICC|nr:cell division protein FtsK [Nesterenkonia cremea]GGE78146.1 hypothetical protein GCM10011401_26740 [Nesterenkonia cremea]
MSNCGSMGIERKRVRVGQKFRPDNPKHVQRVRERIEEDHGPGFELDGFEPDEGLAIFKRESNTVVTSHAGNDSKIIKLPQGTKQSDGKSRAVSLADTYPGYQMTTFEPHRRRAIISKLSEDVIRARDAISTALRAEPWDIQVSKRDDEGYSFTLPAGYRPSKHDDALHEVATVIIGEPGWYVETDTHRRTGALVPAELATFEAVYKTPMPKKMDAFDHTKKDHFQVPMGIALPDPGQSHQVQYLNLEAHQMAQLGGTAGSGKTVSINAYIAYLLARRAEMVIIDTPSKSADFMWCQEFLIPGGWGCDSIRHAAATAEMVRQEGARRAKELKRQGAVNWKDLPADKGFKPMVVVIDELTALYAMDSVPKIPKDAPPKQVELKERAEATNFAKSLLKDAIKNIAAEFRFVGICLLASTQVASATTGIDPALRTNLGHKLLMGSKTTEANRRLVFSRPEAVPTIPHHVREDPKASRGVGAIEPEGDTPAVFKSYFRTTDEYRDWLISLGVPQRSEEAVTPDASWVAEVFGEDDIDDGGEDLGPAPEAPKHRPGPAGSKAVEQWDALALDG